MTFAFRGAFGDDFADSLSDLFKTSLIAEGYLDHEDWRKRAAALEVLIKHWKPTNAICLCKKMIRDPHEQVRNMAMGFLSDLLAHTGDSSACKHLASIAIDNSEPIESRRSAYHAITRIMSTGMISNEMFETQATEVLNNLLPDIDINWMLKLIEEQCQDWFGDRRLEGEIRGQAQT